MCGHAAAVAVLATSAPRAGAASCTLGKPPPGCRARDPDESVSSRTSPLAGGHHGPTSGPATRRFVNTLLVDSSNSREATPGTAARPPLPALCPCGAAAGRSRKRRSEADGKKPAEPPPARHQRAAHTGRSAHANFPVTCKMLFPGLVINWIPWRNQASIPDS